MCTQAKKERHKWRLHTEMIRQLIHIIIDTGFVIMFLLAKLMHGGVRDSLLNRLLPPVCVAPYRQSRQANGAVNGTDTHEQRNFL
jgi:hypothetical protein